MVKENTTFPLRPVGGWIDPLTMRPVGPLPYRYELEMLMLDAVGATPALRNTARQSRIQTWLDKYYPDQVMQNKVMDMLDSIPGWEHA